MVVGQQIAGMTLLGPAPIAEPGAWWFTDHESGGVRTWVRTVRDDVYGDPSAIATAAERLRHVSHDVIPRLAQYDRDENALFVRAPYGVPLSCLLEHRQSSEVVITPALVLELGRVLADALIAAHDSGRPHGHVSPDQIWITPTGRVVLWGLAAGPDVAPPDRWIPPERSHGERGSGYADQWALAAILAALITGREPWRGDDPRAEAAVGDTHHLYAPVLQQWAPLGRLLQRSLAAQVTDRFPELRPLRSGLESLRARVAAPSGLPEMGQYLCERFGLPVPTLPQPAPPAVSAEPPAAPSVSEAADPVGDAVDAPEPPLRSGSVPRIVVPAPAPPPVRSPAVRVATPEELGPPTSPTSVPRADDPAKQGEPIPPDMEATQPVEPLRAAIAPPKPKPVLAVDVVGETDPFGLPSASDDSAWTASGLISEARRRDDAPLRSPWQRALDELPLLRIGQASLLFAIFIDAVWAFLCVF